MFPILTTPLPGFAPAFAAMRRALRRPPSAVRFAGSDAPGPICRMAKGESATFDRPAGRVVDCLRGSVWITFDHDPRDVVLDGGRSHVVDRDRRMMIHALEPSTVRIGPATGA